MKVSWSYKKEVSKMVVILVAITFMVAILAKAVIHHPARKKRVAQVRFEKEWGAISPVGMMPEGIRA